MIDCGLKNEMGGNIYVFYSSRLNVYGDDSLKVRCPKFQLTWILMCQRDVICCNPKPRYQRDVDSVFSVCDLSRDVDSERALLTHGCSVV